MGGGLGRLRRFLLLAIVRYGSWNKFLDDASLKAGSGKWEGLATRS